MYIGIVGGGINGLCCAWQLVQQGHRVRLYERNKLLHATSRASSKLLHGGLRYLENGEFRLVKEALRERDAWIKRAVNLAKLLRLIMPVYRDGRRGRFKVGAGLLLYDVLAGKSDLPGSRWLRPEDILDLSPDISGKGLLGGYEFSDGQMDDYALGSWVAEQAKQSGGSIFEDSKVARLEPNDDVITSNGQIESHDRVINAAGRWAKHLLDQSGIASPYELDLVRGSHLIP
jgi:glycerol-3-phosphate dehydrogenase